MKKILKEIEERDLINETLNEVVYYINEDRTIASIVKTSVVDIKKTMENQINQTQDIPYNKNGVSLKKGTFEKSLFDSNIVFKWQYYNFVNKVLKDSIRVNNNTGGYIKLTAPDCYEIGVVLKGVQNDIDWIQTLETIQHELEHLWELKNRNKSYNDENLYDLSQDLLKSNNYYEFYTGTILYLSRKWEQRAYANGVYSHLMNHKFKELTRENLKETQLYKALLHLKQGVNLIKGFGENNWVNSPETSSLSNELRDVYRITYSRLIKIGENAIRNITRILGRTLSKVEDDLKKEQNENVKFPYVDFEQLNEKFHGKGGILELWKKLR